MAGYYGKRPIWQWVLIYAVVGGVIYFLIYYFIFAPKGGYNKMGSYIKQQSSSSSSPASGY